jgi:hypothetical protein
MKSLKLAVFTEFMVADTQVTEEPQAASGTVTATNISSVFAIAFESFAGPTRTHTLVKAYD